MLWCIAFPPCAFLVVMYDHDSAGVPLSDLAKRAHHRAHFILPVHVQATPKIDREGVYNHKCRSQIDQTLVELLEPRFVEAEQLRCDSNAATTSSLLW